MPTRIRQIFTVAALVANAAGAVHAQPSTNFSPDVAVLHYPETRRGDQVDDYHGTKVADPYRWLEGDVRESTEVAEWVKKENDIARTYLDAIPQRPQIMHRLTELWNYERYSPPTVKAGKYFYLKNDGLQNQAVLFVADAYDTEGRVLLEPNTWTKDGTAALAHTSVSEDGKYLAYARAESGSDWQQIYVLEIATGKELPDHLKWARFSEIEWAKDGSGFFYNRYPEPKAGEQYQSVAKNQSIYFHTLGTEQAEDRLVYNDPENPDWSFGIEATHDGKFDVLSISRSTDPQNQVRVREVAKPDGPWTTLVGDFDNEFNFVANVGSKFYFLTDFEPTKRIVAMDLAKPGRENVREIVPADKGTMTHANILSGKLIVESLVDVLPRVRTFDLFGKPLGDVKLPGIGSVAGFGGDQDDKETFYSFASYNTPTQIYRYDVTTGDSKLVRAAKVKFDPDKYVVEQVFYNSKDGTRVPILIGYRKDLDRTKPQPTLLYGYGGYSISVQPGFSADYIAWMEMGGILAVANLRGGGEYGEDWHLGGKNLKKQNVFDDFIAAAEWLQSQGYTSREKLAIMGGSNGGLLVGAVEVQRPELFGACIPIVGVMDMLRFHLFTAGQFWRDEFGSSEKPDEFLNLMKYSPLHNIREGVDYPPTLVMTADTDDRVVPMHSFKFGAALQRAQAGKAPILLRIESRAGHGSATPVTKRIEEAADRWAFLVKNLGMDVPVEK